MVQSGLWRTLCAALFFFIIAACTDVWENRLLIDTAFTISTFGEDEAGELYLADYAGGDIYRIGVQ